MKRRLVGIGLLILVAGAGMALTWGIAVYGAFQPGARLYGWQRTSERLYQRLLSDEALAQYHLELIDRRFADLTQASGTDAEADAFEGFLSALQEGVDGVDTASPEAQTTIRNAMLDLSNRAPAVIRFLNAIVKDEAKLAELGARMSYINAWAMDPGVRARVLSAAVGDNWDSITMHAVFPLTGAHPEASCDACHRDGSYATAPVECADCHQNARPSRHFPGQCDLCHSETGWGSAGFGHQGVPNLDCAGCHLGKSPDNHFEAQCSACHEVGNWDAVTFNHAAIGATDCQRCHQDEQPGDHYPGQCSLCHLLEGWQETAFDHLSIDSCSSCHEGLRPADHFPGDCATCHEPGDWGGAIFNHQGVESCALCHESWRPPGHFTGDCVLCHTPGTFGDATFNHAGAEDCLACHLEDRPGGHFERQCSQCHNTQGWFDPVYGHTFPRNHGGANPNACGTCHTAGLASYTCFACHDAGGIDREHRDEGVNYHLNCAACHPRGHH